MATAATPAAEVCEGTEVPRVLLDFSADDSQDADAALRISGSLAIEGGQPAGFVGWVDLLASLEKLLRAEEVRDPTSGRLLDSSKGENS
jgi:hypothetical protein